jgi:hypothetical membrane protein
MDEQTAADVVQRRINPKCLLWIGVVAPLFIVGLVLIAAAVTSNYSHFRHAVSTLGADSMPYPAVLNVAMIVYGLLMWAFAYGLYDQLGRDRRARVTSIMIAVHGLGVLVAGVLHDDILKAGETISAEAIVHSTFAVASYFALVAAMCVFSYFVRRSPSWKGLVWFTSIAIATSMPLLFLFVFKIGSGLGLFQRVGYGITLFWMFVVTLRIIWLKRKSANIDLS